MVRKLLIATPLYLVLIVVVLGLNSLLAPPSWAWVAAGAGGWLLALSLRAPIAVVAGKVSPEKAETIVVASSGALEEPIRLAAVLIGGTNFARSLAIGTGWAAIEIVFTLVNGFATAILVDKGDERSERVRSELASRGLLCETAPYLGTIERASASAFHIGLTLMVSKLPWTVFVLVVVHSLLNLAAIRFLPRIFLVEAITFVLGSAALIGGLYLWTQT